MTEPNETQPARCPSARRFSTEVKTKSEVQCCADECCTPNCCSTVTEVPSSPPPAPVKAPQSYTASGIMNGRDGMVVDYTTGLVTGGARGKVPILVNGNSLRTFIHQPVMDTRDITPPHGGPAYDLLVYAPSNPDGGISFHACVCAFGTVTINSADGDPDTLITVALVNTDFFPSGHRQFIPIAKPDTSYDLTSNTAQVATVTALLNVQTELRQAGSTDITGRAQAYFLSTIPPMAPGGDSSRNAYTSAGMSGVSTEGGFTTVPEKGIGAVILGSSQLTYITTGGQGSFQKGHTSSPVNVQVFDHDDPTAVSGVATLLPAVKLRQYSQDTFIATPLEARINVADVTLVAAATTAYIRVNFLFARVEDNTFNLIIETVTASYNVSIGDSSLSKTVMPPASGGILLGYYVSVEDVIKTTIEVELSFNNTTAGTSEMGVVCLFSNIHGPLHVNRRTHYAAVPNSDNAPDQQAHLKYPIPPNLADDVVNCARLCVGRMGLVGEANKAEGAVFERGPQHVVTSKRDPLSEIQALSGSASSVGNWFKNAAKTVGHGLEKAEGFVEKHADGLLKLAGSASPAYGASGAYGSYSSSPAYGASSHKRPGSLLSSLAKRQDPVRRNLKALFTSSSFPKGPTTGDGPINMETSSPEPDDSTPLRVLQHLFDDDEPPRKWPTTLTQENPVLQNNSLPWPKEFDNFTASGYGCTEEALAREIHTDPPMLVGAATALSDPGVLDDLEKQVLRQVKNQQTDQLPLDLVQRVIRKAGYVEGSFHAAGTDDERDDDTGSNTFETYDFDDDNEASTSKPVTMEQDGDELDMSAFGPSKRRRDDEDPEEDDEDVDVDLTDGPDQNVTVRKSAKGKRAKTIDPIVADTENLTQVNLDGLTWMKAPGSAPRISKEDAIALTNDFYEKGTLPTLESTGMYPLGDPTLQPSLAGAVSRENGVTIKAMSGALFPMVAENGTVIETLLLVSPFGIDGRDYYHQPSTGYYIDAGFHSDEHDNFKIIHALTRRFATGNPPATRFFTLAREIKDGGLKGNSWMLAGTLSAIGLGGFYCATGAVDLNGQITPIADISKKVAGYIASNNDMAPFFMFPERNFKHLEEHYARNHPDRLLTLRNMLAPGDRTRAKARGAAVTSLDAAIGVLTCCYAAAVKENMSDANKQIAKDQLIAKNFVDRLVQLARLPANTTSESITQREVLIADIKKFLTYQEGDTYSKNLTSVQSRARKQAEDMQQQAAKVKQMIRQQGYRFQRTIKVEGKSSTKAVTFESLTKTIQANLSKFKTAAEKDGLLLISFIKFSKDKKEPSAVLSPAAMYYYIKAGVIDGKIKRVDLTSSKEGSKKTVLVAGLPTIKDPPDGYTVKTGKKSKAITKEAKKAGADRLSKALNSAFSLV